MIAPFRESAFPPHRVEPVAWSASVVTSPDGGYTFAAARNAGISDAAIHPPHNMPAPTHAASATPSSHRLNRERNGFTRPRQNNSSAARGFRIPSPDHRNRLYLHRPRKCRQTGRSTYTDRRGHRGSLAAGPWGRISPVSRSIAQPFTLCMDIQTHLGTLVLDWNLQTFERGSTSPHPHLSAEQHLTGNPRTSWNTGFQSYVKRSLRFISSSCAVSLPLYEAPPTVLQLLFKPDCFASTRSRDDT